MKHIKETLERLDAIPERNAPMTVEREATAATIARNKEFLAYVADRADALRSAALIESDGDFSPEVLGTRVLTTRGALLELDKMYRFFQSCLINTNKRSKESKEDTEDDELQTP